MAAMNTDINAKSYLNSSYKASQRLAQAIICIILTFVSLLVLYPLVYTVSAAFTPGNSVSALSIIPFGNGVTSEHFVKLFTQTNYLLWFKNTIIIALGTSITTVIVCSLAAYIFSRFRFAFKKHMMMALLILQIFPSFIGMVSIYVILMRIGGLDTLWGMILIYLAGNIPYNTWLVKSYIDSIPKSLDEAARIDGASNATTFFKIVLPQAKPIITFLGITSFTGPWMEFIFSKLILRSNENMTLALGLYAFVSDKKNEFTDFCAGSILIAIPFIIFFILTQKMLVTSLGGAIIGVQIENEYGHCGGLNGEEGEKHMKLLTEMAKEIGYDAPLYTATGWGGAVTGGLLPVMGGYCDAPWDQSTDKLAPSGNYVITYERNDHGIGSDHHIGYGVTFDFNDFPYLTAELGGGLQVTKHRRTVPSGQDIGAMSLTKLASGCNLLGYYMYHGGTNPHGKLTTLQESTATGYLNDLPEYSYDFKAPLREYGQRAESFGEIKLLSMFVKDFGSELCEMPAYIPESTSSDPNDLSDLRMSVRHNGKKGYIFVNNYQRLYDMSEHKNTVLSAELDDEKITLPPVDIGNGDYFFYPVNMQTGGGTLKYITATPLCTVNGKAVLYTDKPYEYEAVGNAEFTVISRADALNAYKLGINGEEYLIISSGIVCEKENGFRIYGEKAPEIKTYPKLKKVPEGFEFKTEEKGLYVYSCTESCDDKPTVSFKLISENDGVKKYEINIANILECEECYVKIDYTGDKSRLYIDGQLADDDFYTGEGWTTGLARYGFPKKFEVEIYPLFKDDRIYLEHTPEFDDSMKCEITSADAVCEYVFDIEL